MIVHRDVERLARGHQAVRHGDVLCARRRISARVVVRDDERGGVAIERFAQDFARMDLDAGDAAFPHNSVRQEPVRGIEEEDAEHLARELRHLVMEIGDQPVSVGHDGSGKGLALEDAPERARKVRQEGRDVGRPVILARPRFLEALQYARQRSKRVDQAAADGGGFVADQAADQVGKELPVFFSLRNRLRVLSDAKIRISIWR